MARRARTDAPDTYHHVMNRGIARRPIFENDRDRRFFLALLAREVRRGRIEVLAFSVMLTHFHLLLRSVTGELPKAMQRLQMLYSRWFNRSRRRDGPLFRGRYLSRHVDTLSYRRQVVTYIHDNAVAAGLVAHPVDDEWSSARHYANDKKRPRWLATAWVDDEMKRRGTGKTKLEKLESAFASRVDPEFRAFVEQQLSQRPILVVDEDVTLKYAGSRRVVQWAIRKSRLADGTKPFQPVLAGNVAETTLARLRKKAPTLLDYLARAGQAAWRALHAGLLRMLAGCTHREIGMRVGRHATTVCRDLQVHRERIESDRAYERLTAVLVNAALRAA